MANTYNGWTNRPTWLVSVWGDFESREDVKAIRSMLEEQYDEMPNGILKDMIDMNEINWDEIMSQFEDELTDESKE